MSPQIIDDTYKILNEMVKSIALTNNHSNLDIFNNESQNRLTKAYRALQEFYTEINEIDLYTYAITGNHGETVRKTVNVMAMHFQLISFFRSWKSAKNLLPSDVQYAKHNYFLAFDIAKIHQETIFRSIHELNNGFVADHPIPRLRDKESLLYKWFYNPSISHVQAIEEMLLPLKNPNIDYNTVEKILINIESSVTENEMLHANFMAGKIQQISMETTKITLLKDIKKYLIPEKLHETKKELNNILSKQDLLDILDRNTRINFINQINDTIANIDLIQKIDISSPLGLFDLIELLKQTENQLVMELFSIEKLTKNHSHEECTLLSTLQKAVDSYKFSTEQGDHNDYARKLLQLNTHEISFFMELFIQEYSQDDVNETNNLEEKKIRISQELIKLFPSNKREAEGRIQKYLESLPIRIAANYNENRFLHKIKSFLENEVPTYGSNLIFTFNKKPFGSYYFEEYISHTTGAELDCRISICLNGVSLFDIFAELDGFKYHYQSGRKFPNLKTTTQSEQLSNRNALRLSLPDKPRSESIKDGGLQVYDLDRSVLIFKRFTKFLIEMNNAHPLFFESMIEARSIIEEIRTKLEDFGQKRPPNMAIIDLISIHQELMTNYSTQQRILPEIFRLISDTTRTAINYKDICIEDHSISNYVKKFVGNDIEILTIENKISMIKVKIGIEQSSLNRKKDILSEQEITLEKYKNPKSRIHLDALERKQRLKSEIEKISDFIFQQEALIKEFEKNKSDLAEKSKEIFLEKDVCYLLNAEYRKHRIEEIQKFLRTGSYIVTFELRANQTFCYNNTAHEPVSGNVFPYCLPNNREPCTPNHSVNPIINLQSSGLHEIIDAKSKTFTPFMEVFTYSLKIETPEGTVEINEQKRKFFQMEEFNEPLTPRKIRKSF